MKYFSWYVIFPTPFVEKLFLFYWISLHIDYNQLDIYVQLLSHFLSSFFFISRSIFISELSIQFH